ncbi:MAG: hypothetical protein JNJ80_25725 [Gemmatimonadetes bacterium]|nr:hypothetical protein [Gemmatimonadota bacterium]
MLATIAAGTRHTCAVTTGGMTYCWGFDGDGQLGRGRVLDRPTAVAGGLRFGQP